MSSSPGGAVPVKTDLISCDETLKLLKSCKDNPLVRILFIDIRSKKRFDTSHLCLDSRLEKSPVKNQVNVINIDLAKITGGLTISKIKNSLSREESDIFQRRKENHHVIVVDDESPENKIVDRLKRALTTLDCTVEKITVEPKVLEDGFRQWSDCYPQYTTSEPESDEQRKPTIINSNANLSNEFVRLSVNSNEKKQTPVPLNEPTTVDRLPQTLPTVTKPQPVVPPKPSQHEVQLNARLQSQSQSQAQSILPHQPNDQNNNVQDKSTPKIDRNKKPNQTRQGDTLDYHKESFNVNSQSLDFKPCEYTQSDSFSITGLTNLGNTCFMNSIIQCLAYNPSIVNYFNNDTYSFTKNIDARSGEGDKKSGTNGELAYQFGLLVRELNTNIYRWMTPKSFYHSIAKHTKFADGKQHDSHEFMIDLFDKLHHDLKPANKSLPSIPESNNLPNGTVDNASAWKKFCEEHLDRNNSKIHEEYQGIYMHTLIRRCGHKSTSFESFFAVSLPIPVDYSLECSLEECLKLFFNKEQLELKCDDCNLTSLTVKKIDITKLPTTLIIHLKRFEQDGQKSIKKDTLVKFPLFQDIKSVSVHGIPLERRYSLQAIVNHNGNLHEGHYFAFSKIIKNKQQKWYKFSDRDVHEINENELCTDKAFILFYSLLGYK